MWHTASLRTSGLRDEEGLSEVGLERHHMRPEKQLLSPTFGREPIRYVCIVKQCRWPPSTQSFYVPLATARKALSPSVNHSACETNALPRGILPRSAIFVFSWLWSERDFLGDVPPFGGLLATVLGRVHVCFLEASSARLVLVVATRLSVTGLWKGMVRDVLNSWIRSDDL